MASLAFLYHKRPNGSASKRRSTPRLGLIVATAGPVLPFEPKLAIIRRRLRRNRLRMQRRVKVGRLRVLNMFIAPNQVAHVSRDRPVIPVAHCPKRVQKQAARYANTKADYFVLVALFSVGNFVVKRLTFSPLDLAWRRHNCKNRISDSNRSPTLLTIPRRRSRGTANMDRILR